MIRTLISCLIVLCATAAAPAKDNQAIIPFQEGSIRLTFLNDNAVRVEYAKEFSDTLPEWIYVNKSPRTGKLTKPNCKTGPRAYRPAKSRPTSTATKEPSP